MTFLLADETVIEKHCKDFRSHLAKFVRPGGIGGKKIVSAEDLPTLVLGICHMLDEHFLVQKHPVPVKAFLNLGNEGTMACFQPGLWQVSLNDVLALSKEDVPQVYAPVIFNSIYHEYRHAEQFCLMIRYVWALHPAWLHYQDLLYNRERNAFVPPSVQVKDSAVRAAWADWQMAVKSMSDDALAAMIRQYLTTVGGAQVALRAVRALATQPLSLAAGCADPIVKHAATWFQSRFRTWAEEYGGRARLFDPGRMFDADETTAANIAMGDSSVKEAVVDAELKEWNARKPTAYPHWPISASTQEGQTVIDMMRQRKPFDINAMRALFDYLRVRREATMAMASHVYRWYTTVPLEQDTHDLEKKVTKSLRLKEGHVDSVARSAGVLQQNFLPKPVDWTVQS